MRQKYTLFGTLQKSLPFTVFLQAMSLAWWNISSYWNILPSAAAALPWSHLTDRSLPNLHCNFKCQFIGSKLPAGGERSWLPFHLNLSLFVKWVWFIKPLFSVLDSSPLNNMITILPKYLKFSVFSLKMCTHFYGRWHDHDQHHSRYTLLTNVG